MFLIEKIHLYRWYLGIQSKKDPAHVMNEVYKAMQALKCVWHQVNNYRVLCLWAAMSDPVVRVKLAISLYKVQENFFLLDFQRLEVS